MYTIYRVILMVVLVALTQACATARLEVARESLVTPPTFDRVAVPPFINRVGSELPATVPENVAGTVIAKLQKKYPNAFRQVSSTPSHQPGELIVQGKIVKYDPGSKAGRFILIGVGAGSLQLEVALVNAATGETLEEFSTSGKIMAGGVLGASMGIEDMIDSATKKIVERIARYGSGL